MPQTKEVPVARMKKRARKAASKSPAKSARVEAPSAASDVSAETDNFYLSMITRGSDKPVLFRMEDPVKDAKMTTIIQLVANTVLDFARPKVEGKDLAELLRPDRVKVVTLPDATVQAVTVWMPPRHVIAVNRGLMMFIYRLARAVAPHVITRGKDDPPAPPESTAISLVAAMIDFMSSPVRAPLIEDWPTGPREIKTAENMTTAAERFVISHEIAHIMRRHAIADASSDDPTTKQTQDLDSRPVQEEIEADTIGAFLCIESQPDPRPGAVGIVLALYAIELAEKAGVIVPDEAHPSASDRKQNLWQALPLRYRENFAVITSWADQMTDLLTRIGDAALKVRQVRRDEAREALDTMFREHLDREVPRNPRDDKATLERVRPHYQAAPGALIEVLVENLLDEKQFTEVGSRSDEKFKRHEFAHFLARNALGPMVQSAIGIQRF